MSPSTRIRWLGLVLMVCLATASRPWAQAADAPTFTVIAASAFLRNEPSAQALATYSIFQGQVYPIIGRNADSSWLQLEVFKATKGTWVLASLGKVTGDLTSVSITTGTGQAGSSATATAGLPLTPAAVGPTPTASSTDPSEICVLLYNDSNGNGSLDPNEGAIAGGQLTILDTRTGAVAATYTTTPAEPRGHCFKNLPAGAYTVAAAAPAGYNATVASSTTQHVVAGARYELFFGAQPGASAASAGGIPDFRTVVLSALGVVAFLLAAGIAAAIILRRK